MRHLKLLIPALALLATLPFGAPARAWPSEIRGLPAVFGESDIPEGLYLWVNDTDRLLVRVQGDRRYRLTFRLKYGQFHEMRPNGLDANDHVEYNQERTELYVNISGSDTPEGIGVSGDGNRVIVTCRTGSGDRCSTDQIYFGSDGNHPDDVPFIVSRKD